MESNDRNERNRLLAARLGDLEAELSLLRTRSIALEKATATGTEATREVQAAAAAREASVAAATSSETLDPISKWPVEPAQATRVMEAECQTTPDGLSASSSTVEDKERHSAMARASEEARMWRAILTSARRF